MEKDIGPPSAETANADAGKYPGGEELDSTGAQRLVAMLDPEVLGNVSIELSATLGRGTMTMHRLASLASDDVVTLDTPLNGAIDLSLNGTLVARGEIVAVGDQFGVRVTEILARKA